MITKKGKKCLAFILAATLTLEPLATQAIYASDVVYESVDSGSALLADESQKVKVQLQNGTAVIPQGADIETAKKAIAKALVVNADKVDTKSLEWEYECEGKAKTTLKKNTAFGSLEGFTTSTTTKTGLFGNKITEYSHPAFLDKGEGDFKFRLKGSEEVVTLHRAYKYESSIVLKEGSAVSLTYNDDMTVDYNALEAELFSTFVDTENSSPASITAEQIKIEYYATAKIGAVGSLGRAWMPVCGGKSNGLEYPGMPEGTQRVRFSYAGDDENTAASVEASVQVKGREQSAFVLKDAPYEVSMAFNADQSYDFDATARAIYDAVIAETNPAGLTYDDVSMEYNAGTDIIPNWQPLNSTNWTAAFKKFGPGEWTIRIKWDGNKNYKGTQTQVNVTTADNRIAAAVVCREGVSFSYNMDTAVMKQSIFDQVIDWDNSTLPAKDTLSVDDFTMEYYGVDDVAGVEGVTRQWAPIEGGKVNLLTYLQMGAGEQQIRITYKGNAEYRPSASAETSVTVNKAKVNVKVKSTNIYAGDALPQDFVTTNPSDRFDVYTIYAGLTSNVNAGIYLQMPEKYTNSTVLKLIDPVVSKIYGKSFTQMMQDGMTVGELRKLFSTQELLDTLKKLHIDTGTVGQILEIINKLPSVADTVRVSFGTPNRAGLYTVTAVTDNKNYETGVGVGALLVKMHSKGTKLSWNQSFTNGKLKASDVASFDFGATLSYDGDVSISQSNVHYLYSGFTSKWKPYSSTKAPTEPGRYVVTVVTIGGNYQAAPITRSFQIVK